MNTSFSATTEQVRQHRKYVTRRVDKSLRLSRLTPGTILQGIEKAQGIKKGEHVVKLDWIVILEVNREPLKEIRNYDRMVPSQIIRQYHGFGAFTEMELEGFPDLSAEQFIEKFCQINPKCTPDTEITRILFDYVKVE